MALTNQYSDCEVLDLDPTAGRGPFLATQHAVDADDPRQQDNLYFLRRDGVWVECVTHMLANEKDRVSVLFDSLPEIVQLLAALPPTVKSVRAANVDRARLAALLQQVEAGGGMMEHFRCLVKRYRQQRSGADSQTKQL